jgi:hypothetical protein
MKMYKPGILAVGTAALVVLLPAYKWSTGKVRAQTARVPFVASSVRFHFDGQGVLRMRDDIVYGARSDGSSSTTLARSILQKDGVTYRVVKSRNIVDIATRKMMRVDHFTESVTTIPLSERDISEAGAKPDTSCIPAPQETVTKVTVLGAETVLGYQTVKVREERPYQPTDGTKLVTDVNYSPALDCFALKESSSLILPDGAAGARNLMEVTLVAMGEPDGTLFDAPTGYTERPPSEVMAERDRRVGDGSCASCGATARYKELIDNRYYDARNAAGR